MELAKPLWSGKNRDGIQVHIIYYEKVDKEYPFFCLYHTYSRPEVYWAGSNGRYQGTSGSHINGRDLVNVPKDFDKHLAEIKAAEEIALHSEPRKDAIMECNKVALILTAEGKTAESRGAQQCVARLTALLGGKKPPKIKKASK